jgi:DNA topoisomerase-1
MVQAATSVLTHRDLIKIDRDHEAAASVANLVYVSDKEEGIARIKKGTGFSYMFRGRAVRNEKQIERIRKLAIPPAWTKVWICTSANGHIQATGCDAMGRKQYRYHARWSALRQETKFHRLLEFGKILPLLRERLQKDLSLQGFPEAKVIAMVLSVMEKTYIRVGNEGYEKLYGSFGLTTLKNDHVNIRGDQITFSFRGKKGIYHKLTITNKRFARIIRQCRAIPGKELFQYFDEGGSQRKIDSGQVNQYIKDCIGDDFTTKDFRTWAGTRCMLTALKELPWSETHSDIQKNITRCLQTVSSKLGNTVTVCKKYYVHPELVRLYKEGALTSLIEDASNEAAKKYGLTPDEELLMSVLEVIAKNKVEVAAL